MEGPKGQLRVAQERIGLPQFYPARVSWPNESWRWAFGVHEPPSTQRLDGGQDPRLYKSWEITDQGFTVQLREGLQFHKGWGELTSEDVVWSANETMRPDTVFVNINIIRLYWDNWEVLDKYTLFIPWKQPAPLFYSWFENLTAAHPVVFNTFSKKYLEQEGEEPPLDVGTGPFEMTRFVTEDRVELDAVPDHWRQTPEFAKLTLLEIREPATRIAALKTGEVDVADVPLATLQDVTATPGIKPHEMKLAGSFCHMSLGGQYYELTESYVEGTPPNDTIYSRKKKDPAEFRAWIEEHPWIGDVDDPADMERAKKVRLALAHAIDKESIVRNVLAGNGSPLYTYRFIPSSEPIFLSTGTFDRWAKELPPSGNVEKAKALLAEAGYPDGFNVDLIVSTGARAEVQPISEAVVPMLEAIGVTAKVSAMEVQEAIRRSREKAQDQVGVGCGSREALSLMFEQTSLTGSSTQLPYLKEYVDRSEDVGMSLDRMRVLTDEFAETGFQNQWSVPLVVVHRFFVSGPAVGSWDIVPGASGHPNGWETVTHAK